MATDIGDSIYHNEDKARERLEAVRWPNGPVCPHCGSVNNATQLRGKSTRPGVYKCRDCAKPFSATVGTLFERSHIPLHKWLLAVHLLSSSKKGMAAHQLHRMLGVTYKTAWFMAHRIREAMREPSFPGPLGTGGGTVEADETYVGGKKKNRHKEERAKPDQPPKAIVLSLVERDGSVRSFHVATVNSKTLRPILREQISQSARLNTDEGGSYRGAKKDFEAHETVNHLREEYVRGQVHTNTVEGYFSILKRGIYGVYHHVSPEHLERYLSEFDFRYSHRKIDDTTRAQKALKGIDGKRLTYRRPTKKGASEGKEEALTK